MSHVLYVSLVVQLQMCDVFSQCAGAYASTTETQTLTGFFFFTVTCICFSEQRKKQHDASHTGEPKHKSAALALLVISIKALLALHGLQVLHKTLPHSVYSIVNARAFM